MAKKKSLDRRQFLGRLLAWATSGTVGGIAWDGFKTWQANPGPAVNGHGRQDGHGRQVGPTDRSKLLKILFGGDRKFTKFRGGYAHPQYPGRCHPDDRLAIESVVDCARGLCSEESDDLAALGFPDEGSFVCTGSPVSNDIIRHFLQYQYKDDAKPALGLTRVQNPIVKLPFEFVFDPVEIKRVAKGHAHHSPDGKMITTNWTIKASDGYHVPNTENGSRDYLLITRIPNWQETSRYGTTENVLTMIGGTHGVGTNSVRILLQDELLLTQINVINEKYQYWQALMEVNSMERARHPFSDTPRLMALSLSKKIQFDEVKI
ncbi:MAG TPA: hypothetical protein VFB31_16595 [Pseudolabrys sp.]|nr:hypothetical protein [Pseudolabrys sp.]